ncbi:MAG: hypothetical protein M3Y53_12395 [Thermoproteota archaeon]|nr:hypothetical protein [Thermoproteota archaeon]
MDKNLFWYSDHKMAAKNRVDHKEIDRYSSAHTQLTGRKEIQTSYLIEKCDMSK